MSSTSFSTNNSTFQAALSIISISFPLYSFSSVRVDRWYSYYYLNLQLNTLDHSLHSDYLLLPH